MVDKKGLKAINRNEIILVILALGFMAFVFAMTSGGEIIYPASGSNHSGLINITCNSTGIYGAINASIYFNKSGGAITSTPTYLLGNGTNITASGAGGIDNVTQINVTINTVGWDSSRYNLSCTVCNLSEGAGDECWNVSSIFNVTFDNTAPRVVGLSDINRVNGVVDGECYNGSITLNLSVLVNDSSWVVDHIDKMRGVGSVYFNITNWTEDEVNFTAASNGTTDSWLGAYWNATWNITDTTLFPDGIYNITVWVNETATDEVNFASNENQSESIQITIDNTGPSSIAYTCSPSSVIVGQIVICTCTGADATSGINYTSDTTTTSSSSQIITEITTTTAGTFTKTCVVRDRCGNSTSTTASYTVTGAGVSDGGNGGGISSTSGTTISEASSVVLSGFEEETGVEQIEVTVNAAVSNALVIVTRYETQPAEVSVAKSGSVYKYIQVEARNFADKLESAIMRIKIEKDWVTSNNLQKENVAVFRYDENTAEKWDELTTTFVEEDAGYYYYDVALDSFSYFVIGETLLVDEEEEEEPERNLLWLWIVIGIVVIAVIVGGGFAAKKKK